MNKMYRKTEQKTMRLETKTHMRDNMEKENRHQNFVFHIFCRGKPLDALLKRETITFPETKSKNVRTLPKTKERKYREKRKEREDDC